MSNLSKPRFPGGFIIGGILGACIVGRVYDLELSLWFVIPALAYATLYMLMIVGTVIRVMNEAKTLREAEDAREAEAAAKRATVDDVR